MNISDDEVEHLIDCIFEPDTDDPVVREKIVDRYRTFLSAMADHGVAYAASGLLGHVEATMFQMAVTDGVKAGFISGITQAKVAQACVDTFRLVRRPRLDEGDRSPSSMSTTE